MVERLFHCEHSVSVGAWLEEACVVCETLPSLTETPKIYDAHRGGMELEVAPILLVMMGTMLLCYLTCLSVSHEWMPCVVPCMPHGELG